MFKLPEKIIFIDVNGTLIADDSLSGTIPADALHALQRRLPLLRSAGYSVGLCSDSPLPELREYARYVGLDDLIVAENGNVVFYNGEQAIVRELGGLQGYKQAILDIATRAGHGAPLAVVAPEFGGGRVDYDRGVWGFGAHREASVTVFAPAALVLLLGKHFTQIADSQISIDCSPEYNYFAIHPGKYRRNKGLTLTQLSDNGSSVVMIGNSGSDWVEPASGVRCAFVAGARISAVMQAGAYALSDKSLCHGVAAILERVLVAPSK